MDTSDTRGGNSLVLCKVLFFCYFGAQAAYGPFIPLLLTSSGASRAEVGFILAFRPFIALFSMPTIGLVADRLAKPRLILVVLISVALSLRLGLLLCTSLMSMFFVLSIAEFFSSPIGSIIDSTVLDCLPDPLQVPPNPPPHSLECAIVCFLRRSRRRVTAPSGGSRGADEGGAAQHSPPGCREPGECLATTAEHHRP